MQMERDIDCCGRATVNIVLHHKAGQSQTNAMDAAVFHLMQKHQATSAITESPGFMHVQI